MRMCFIIVLVSQIHVLILPSPKSVSKVVASKGTSCFFPWFSVALLGQYSWAPSALVCGALSHILSFLWASTSLEIKYKKKKTIKTQMHGT